MCGAGSRRTPNWPASRRAQLAAEAGLTAGVSLLREAENGDGVLWLHGEPLTVERIKMAMRAGVRRRTAARQRNSSSRPVRRVRQGTKGHGPIRFGEPVVVDLWPRDDASSCFADMTRTFAVGPVADGVRAWHEVTKEALDRATGIVRAGVECRAVFDAVCDVFEAAGYATQRTKTPGEALLHGFFHGLGHGVGLELHEGPSMGFLPDGTLLAGDVVTLEPGL